jgi:hypothetical protein
MASFDDLRTIIRRNKLLGMWAAEQLGLAGPEADAYSDALAVGAVDPEYSDVLGRLRKDFDNAGVIQSDEQILCVMDELMLEAAKQTPTTGSGGDAAAVLLARKLTVR